MKKLKPGVYHWAAGYRWVCEITATY